MKSFLSVLTFFCYAVVSGQGEPPLERTNGNVPEELIPAGWIVMGSATGDLNNDHEDDIAFVIEDTNPDNYWANTEMGPTTLNINPRTIIVVLKNKGKESYRIISKNDSFIPPSNDKDAPCLDDPFSESEFSISDGTLLVKLDYFSSCGSYGVTTKSYKFRLKDKHFALIGYDLQEFSRSTGEGMDVSINFLTLKQSVTTGTNEFNSDLNKPVTKWSAIKMDKLLTLEDLNGDTEIAY